ncbi:serine/threonine protein kinase [Aspergillus tamarii]|uniref:Serine/threonine protein kinase n=1 Tax=Aspergillus tamarii TaxID=41984 RepID=A0A5N6UWY1_ASPTM|nr:serine/threonine protein kinase [Aspergillus tamarii]
MTEAVFHKERHVKYFLRCLKTFLPNLYTSNDSNRILLAYFTVAGLDLLGELYNKTTLEERQGYVEWIYHCQVPSGGFRGFTGTDFGSERRTPENEAWDPANIPSTFFALVILLTLGDDLSRVKRTECLQWLSRMQRENGSFGEVLGTEGKIEGGGDLRFCCFGAGTRYILRGKCGEDGLEGIKDIDVDKLVAFIEACQAYDGGIGEGPFCESHSGHTYCAIGALTFLDRLSKSHKPIALLSPKAVPFDSLVRWLVARQTSELGDDEEESDDEDGHSVGGVRSLSATVEEPSIDTKVDQLPVVPPETEGSLRWAGFNGRCNKYADTCYSFWNTASLNMMDRLALVDATRNRRYLLEKTQHIVGGFGKGVGEPPDLLHSYFGLVSLAFQGEPGLESVDPALCASHRTLAQSYHELLEEFSSKDLRSVGNYTLGRLIGKGSFGKVYLASHKLTNGSKVVLKSSSREDTNLPREIHHHRQFLHPHIARLYEVLVTEKLVWLVLEYCPGDELYNYLLNHGPLPVDKVKRIFTQLVGAVAYVHSKSCVHRDLKLENILLDKHENVKLCDFGFTREYEGKASYLQTFCGTICYSAPEMLKGEKYAGEKIDVWSLGIILYALLAGELPFDEDDDQVTKTRILTEDPAYNDRFPDDAKTLINLLLSKRPLIRPSLDEILAHPFLAEHAPEQLAILKIPRPAPFTTPLERTTLQRMKSAGVNIDEVMDSVLAQRCDPLAGWWALLIEKEQRKEQKRERKRREREAEVKNIRRLSAASSRLEKISAALVEVDEEGHTSLNAPLQERGRRDRRSLPSQFAVPELPILPEPVSIQSPASSNPPPPVDKDSVRSASSTRHRPLPPPKDRRRSSRPSTLHVSASQPELAQHNGIFRRRTGRRQYPILSQLASLKHWFVESTKRAKSPHSKAPGAQGTHRKFLSDKLSPSKGQDTGKKSAQSSSAVPATGELSTPTQIKRASNASSLARSSASYPNHRHSYPRQTRPLSTNAGHRNSLSPSPITPRGSYRRSSAGLRGRKSTSSSISSIRSIHHTHTHSKASSVSSNSIGSASTPTARVSRSPHSSVKVLPTTPSASSRFPSNIRLVRGVNNGYHEADDPNGRMTSIFNESAPAPLLYSPSSSLVFARRKRSAFKGPMVHTTNLMVSGGMAAPEFPRSGATVAETSSAARPVARKSQIIEEDIEEDEDIEEVDAFTGTEEEPGSPAEMKIDEHTGLEYASDLSARSSKPSNASSTLVFTQGIKVESSSWQFSEISAFWEESHDII